MTRFAIALAQHPVPVLTQLKLLAVPPELIRLILRLAEDDPDRRVVLKATKDFIDRTYIEIHPAAKC